MFRISGALGALAIGLMACAPVDYSKHVLVAKYDYDGVTYDVYSAEATSREEDGISTVYRLFPEGASPLGNPGSSMAIGADQEITNCGGTLDECKITFGKALEKRKTAVSGKGVPEEGGMY